MSGYFLTTPAIGQAFVDPFPFMLAAKTLPLAVITVIITVMIMMGIVIM
jgi:hypothetical protein